MHHFSTARPRSPRATTLVALLLAMGVTAPNLNAQPAGRSPAAISPPPPPKGPATRKGPSNPAGRAAPAEASNPAGQSLSLAQAVQRALRRNPEVAAERSKRREAALRVSAAKRALFPKLSIEGNALIWDKALPFELGDTSLPPPPADCPTGCLTYMGQLLGSFDLGNLRDQFTLNATVTLAQPVTALFALIEQLKVRKLEAKATKLEQEHKHRQITSQVTRAYLLVLQAERYVLIALDAAHLLQAHLKQARAYRASQMVGQNEVLKVQVALARATQGVVTARSGRDLARANLRRLVNAPGSTRLHLTEKFPDPPPAFTPLLASCQRAAMGNRAELRKLGLQRKMIRAGAKASRIMLWPQATVMGRYEFNHGTGSLTPKNAFFVGLNVSWTFEWGAKKKEADALAAREQRLVHLAKHYRRAVKLEVRKHYLDMRQAETNLGVARKAVGLAKESLRLEGLRFGQGIRTTTDLLDAQRRHQEASATYTNRLYSYYAGLAALRLAMGTQAPKAAPTGTN